MCTVCGCGEAKTVTPDGQAHRHHHDHHHHHDDHQHSHGEPVLNFGSGLGGVHVPGMTQSRIVEVEQDILSENNRLAATNRAWLAGRGILSLNLVSSPGSGKTTLLVRTIEDLDGSVPVAVIEGDQQTSFDADRIRATRAPAVQINTGKGCHLDSHMVANALEMLDPPSGGVLFIENVGNLVCPAAFDLGEAHKVVMLSVTEGDDKPLKYPDMFHAADLMILTKIDLLPHVTFDVERCVGFARRINPSIQLLRVSATSGEGMADWYDWICERRDDVLAPAPEALAASAGA